MTTNNILKERIQHDMKAHMKEKNQKALTVVRLLLSEIKQKEIDEKIELTDEQIVAVIDKMLKQRQQSISQYLEGGREDLAEQERFEITLLKNYLPEPLSSTEIEQMITQAISDAHATSIKEMGQVMAVLKPKLQGRADMGAVSQRIKQLLS